MLVPHEIMEKEFLALAETEGIADIEELNKILDRAVNLKNFLKGKERIPKVARFVADHFHQNVEPLGYKAFLVAVDREACALYKEALDGIFKTQGLPPGYAEIVFTGNHADPPNLKKWHLDGKREKQIRRDFRKPGGREPQGSRSVCKVPKLETQRGGTARAAQRGDLRHLRRGGQHGKGDRRRGVALHAPA